MNTSRIVFLISFLPALIAAVTGFSAGQLDGLTSAKIVGVFVGAVLTGTINGLLAVKALNTDKKETTP